MSAYLDDPPLAFAHRGGAAEGDENTAEAFARAVALGYRYVETDVHATSDGVPVVFHDTTLARVAGRPERIEDLSWAELTTVWPAVPRLDDVLAGWPEIRFNIDVKAASAIEPTVEAVTRVSAGDRVLLASFSDARLARLRLLAGPKVATSLGMRSVARLKAASVGGWRITMPPSAVAAQVPVRYGRVRLVDRRFIGYAHRLGLQVHVWTIDDPAEMHYLLDLGVDGIMTDRVDVLRDVYMSRGVWPTEGNP
ncbi:glycerophosphodiester phosphodiesterase [Phytohabitans aurantiacus]|uniref:Glycerophosphoryl diester phosphodiesterase n=1 Tax=Phytohabitans aurantiacus TaxID=3016789 RepID=A0ABQ5QZV7_9ACTN|nr:glycerophosphodiester phosphodiesterase [Phytohabitans aurantiacus]GLH99156.1 glycerophosphoryl diester phosphodiesterase [Phytohabitans aurantiacus]